MYESEKCLWIGRNVWVRKKNCVWRSSFGASVNVAHSKQHRTCQDLIRQDGRISMQLLRCWMLGKLKGAVWNERRGLQSKKLFSCTAKILALHVAAATIQIIRYLKFEAVPHPPHSPHLVPCDFHAFCPLKEVLCGRQCLHRFGNNINPSPMVSRSLWTYTKCVWNCMENILNNNRTVMYISISLLLVKERCLSCFIYLRTNKTYVLTF